MQIKISSVEGNGQMLDGGAMFGNAPRELWSKWISPDEKGRIPLACRCLLIETDDEKILCETGIGAFFEPKLADRYGVQSPNRHLLLESLARLQVSQDDITSVILSHLHFDHAGGLLPAYSEIQRDGFKLLFPQAEYVVSRSAWQRAQNPHSRDKASFIEELNALLNESKRLRVLERGETYRDFLSFHLSDGHTPGQLLTQVKGDKFSVVFGGDLVPGRSWVHLPLTMGYDRYPELLINEKEALYQSFSSTEWILFFTHDHEVSGASIELSDKGRYQPKDSFKSFERFFI